MAELKIHKNKPFLPYSYSELQPCFSESQLKVHFEEHHWGYYNNLLQLLKKYGVDWQLSEILERGGSGFYNNAAQVHLHQLFWDSLCPKGSSVSPTVAKILTAAFGSMELFKQDFFKKSMGHFGSGYYFLGLSVSGVPLSCVFDNAKLPANLTPLLVVDLWEHSYYIDYRKDKLKYLTGIWEKLNWNTVEKRITEFSNKKSSYL